MPDYAYKPVNCMCGQGELVTITYRIGDYDPAPPCPACGALMTRIIDYVPAAAFKGSGFYTTDYGRPRS